MWWMDVFLTKNMEIGKRYERVYWPHVRCTSSNTVKMFKVCHGNIQDR